MGSVNSSNGEKIRPDFVFLDHNGAKVRGDWKAGYIHADTFYEKLKYLSSSDVTSYVILIYLDLGWVIKLSKTPFLKVELIEHWIENVTPKFMEASISGKPDFTIKPTKHLLDKLPTQKSLCMLITWKQVQLDLQSEELISQLAAYFHDLVEMRGLLIQIGIYKIVIRCTEKIREVYSGFEFQNLIGVSYEVKYQPYSKNYISEPPQFSYNKFKEPSSKSDDLMDEVFKGDERKLAKLFSQKMNSKQLIKSGPGLIKNYIYVRGGVLLKSNFNKPKAKLLIIDDDLDRGLVQR